MLPYLLSFEHLPSLLPPTQLNGHFCPTSLFSQPFVFRLFKAISCPLQRPVLSLCASESRRSTQMLLTSRFFTRAAHHLRIQLKGFEVPTLCALKLCPFCLVFGASPPGHSHGGVPSKWGLATIWVKPGIQALPPLQRTLPSPHT